METPTVSVLEEGKEQPQLAMKGAGGGLAEDDTSTGSRTFVSSTSELQSQPQPSTGCVSEISNFIESCCTIF